jgi:RNA recognition motif. (a.k.a. RRM, RBD, or RNP domain)
LTKNEEPININSRRPKDHTTTTNNNNGEKESNNMSSSDSAKKLDDAKKELPPSPKVEETESAEETGKKRSNEAVSSNSAATDVEKNEGEDVLASDNTATPTTATNGEAANDSTVATSTEKESADPSPPKKAKLEMMPAPAAAPSTAKTLTDDVDEYTLDAPPATANTDDSRIEMPSIILFGLHPLVKESPLRKMCEQYGTVKTIAVKSAFASRYGHVEFATVDEAKTAYNALNGASLLQKQILVQPTKGAQA